MKRRNWHSDAR